MSPQKSPAFSFYARDFLAGTSTMSLQEVGAYVRLLAYQWDAGSVPAEADERARVMGCAKSQERDLWKRIGKKFTLRDGVYYNDRLEEERTKQTERRQRLSDNGKLGGRPPKANGNQQPKQDESNSFTEAKANENQNERLAFASSSSGSGFETGSSPSKHRSVPTLIVGGAEYFRLLETHAFVGSVLRVPKKLHSELLGKSGGAHREQELQDWYLQLNEQLETSGAGTGDVFAWLRPRHQAFAVSRGWIEAAPKTTATKQPDPSHVERMLAIERGERRR